MDIKLSDLGWRPEFSVQVSDDELASFEPCRVLGAQRSLLDVVGEDLAESITPPPQEGEDAITVGDWVLVEKAARRIGRRLDRLGLFRRRAAGTDRRVQLIAANVDTLFIVTSADRDFNVARLERYLALAREGNANPVVVVTKADTNEAASELAAEAARLAPGLVAETLDGRDPSAARALAPWCGTGQTVALVGSSGVGKSTLVNTLTGAGQSTRPVREDDQRGRHSTTARSMHRIAGGGWLLDTPGMRELGRVDAADALDDVFAEITALAAKCRFADCRHESEPGCAVLDAIAAGDVGADRLERFRKLVAENRYNTESLAERRARFKSLGKFYKSVVQHKSARRGLDE